MDILDQTPKVNHTGGKCTRSEIGSQQMENPYKCNLCEQICQYMKDINSHMIKDHQTYKPCVKFEANKCGEASKCRFRHIKLKESEEICYKCGQICTSKTDIINHIKDIHGNEVCHIFLSNQCSRSSAQCIYKHHTKDTLPKSQQKVFWQGPNPPLHSPPVGMLNMSEHIQNQFQVQTPHVPNPLPVNILQMIPQLVSQVLIALIQQTKQ